MKKTLQQYLDNRKFLDKLATEDAYYNIWKSVFEESSVKIKKFTKFMPKRVRNFLYGYADGGRMMLERQISIACMCMEQNGKTPKSWEAELLTEKEKTPGAQE